MDDGGLFRGGHQLQIPFYLLAAERIVPGAVVSDAFLDYVDGGRAGPPRHRGPEGRRLPRALLRGLVDAIAQGHFVQEHTACEWCDFTRGVRAPAAARAAAPIQDQRHAGAARPPLRDVG